MSEATSSESNGEGLAEHAQALELCTYCPKMCRLACPVAEVTGRESTIPWALMGLANHVRKGHLALTPEISRSFYDCTNCLRCQTYCLHDNDVPTALRAARRFAVAEGKEPPEVAAMREHFREQGSMFEAGDREATARAVASAGVENGGPAGLLLACSTAASPDAAALTARALSLVGVRIALPDPALRCCGAPLLDAGLEEDFTRVARENQGMLAGFDRVICDASVCARTLARDYPRVGAALSAPVEDIATTLDRALSEGKLDGARKRPEKAVYHDPCHLGRHAKSYDAPRRVAAALFEKPPAEFPWSRDRGSCCGGGGAFPFVDRRTARAMGGAMTARAKEQGCEMIVTASAECAAMMAEAEPRLPVRTLAALVAEALA